MAVHKLYIDEFDEIDYELIAIHTSLEDYRLAYFINQQLPILLDKCKDDLLVETKSGEAHFSKFNYENFKDEVSWTLIQNKNEITINKKDNESNLFANTFLEISTKVYFLPEFKKVDYFLKVENAAVDSERIVAHLQTIKRVSTAYKVDTDHIKSKNNLIF